jgi:hypothetical protein
MIKVHFLIVSNRLQNAIHDLRYLLDHGYPRDSAMTFVANHYRLALEQRHLLARCVFSKGEVAELRRKAVKTSALRGKRMGVDGYNTLITLESILTCKQVVRCDDGYIRDLRAIFGKYKLSQATDHALAELLEILRRARPRDVVVLFDKQVSRSGELAGATRRGLKKFGLKGNSRATSGVDFKLRAFDVVASSDRAIIWRAKAVWDIPAELLKRKKANILDLKMI